MSTICTLLRITEVGNIVFKELTKNPLQGFIFYKKTCYHKFEQTNLSFLNVKTNTKEQEKCLQFCVSLQKNSSFIHIFNSSRRMSKNQPIISIKTPVKESFNNKCKKTNLSIQNVKTNTKDYEKCLQSVFSHNSFT